MAKAMLRWGLLGASTIARERMAGAIRRCGGEIRAVFSSSQDRGAVFAASLDIPRHTTGFADFFDGLDAVYVSSLNNLHHAHVLAAAEAGLHVLCEKPLALSLAEAQTSATERNADASTLMAMFANQDVFTPATDAEIRQHKNADYPGSPASVETLLQGMHTSVEQINEPLLLISKAAPRKAEHAEDKG